MLLDLKNAEFNKHVAAIRVSSTVKLNARKSWNVLFINAYDDLLIPNKKHQIKVSALADAIGFNSKNTASLKTAIQTLQTTLVEWDIGDKSKEKGVSFDNFASVQMLGYVSVKNGTVTYKFDDDLAKVLYNPIIFQKISLAQQRLFKSHYALILWENCLKYINVGSTGYQPVGDWKKILGARAKTYEKYKRFKELILNKAIAEVNDLSDIFITLEEKKNGRSVTHLKFLVKHNTKANPVPDSQNPVELKSSNAAKFMVSIGISELQTVSLIQEKGLDYINEKIGILKSQKKIKGSASGFLLKAIEKNYLPNQKTKSPDLNYAKSKEEKAKEKADSEAKKQASDNRIQQYIDSLTDEECEEIKPDFLKFLKTQGTGGLVTIKTIEENLIPLKKANSFTQFLIHSKKISA